jgi:hypothetical protein
MGMAGVTSVATSPHFRAASKRRPDGYKPTAKIHPENEASESRSHPLPRMLNVGASWKYRVMILLIVHYCVLNSLPSILEPLSHPQVQSVINASHVNRDAGPCRIKPLYARTAKTKSLMGPRKINVAPAPGSVMDRVRMIEGCVDDAQCRVGGEMQ